MEREKAQQLVVRYGPAIFRLAYARTGSREDAEDVTEETFLRLVRRGKDFQDDEHCRAWLLRVAANCANDMFRAARKRKERPLEEAERLPVQPEPEEGGVLAAVLALPEPYRLPLHLFYYEGLSVAEIASVLGLRPGTVRTRLCRGRNAACSVPVSRGGGAGRKFGAGSAAQRWKRAGLCGIWLPGGAGISPECAI